MRVSNPSELAQRKKKNVNSTIQLSSLRSLDSVTVTSKNSKLRKLNGSDKSKLGLSTQEED